MNDASPVPGSIPPSGPADPEAPPVARELDGPLAVLTMQSPPHNLIGPALVDALLESVRWAAEREARAVLLRSGLRNFSAGADLTLFDSSTSGEGPSLDGTELLRTCDELPMPMLAAVNGICVGGGLELALACDLVVAAESAKLGSVEATLGLNPLMGGIQRVTERAGAVRAKEMAMLARRYDAGTLERWNVINLVVPDERLAAASHTMAMELANGPTVAHASTKAIASVAVSQGVAAADEKMAELQKAIWSSQDLQAGLAALQQSGPGTARFGGR